MRRAVPSAKLVRRCAVALCVVLTATPAHALTPAEEIEIGRRFALEARASLPLVHDVDVQAYVDRIGGEIVAALGEQPFTYQFAVVRDGTVNAFAVPGGYVYVYAGLLTHARSDDEIAGVLGHEVAHVHAHHIARQQEATKLVNYAALVGMLLSVLQPAIGAGALAAQAAKQLEYRREFEQEADYMGARFMRDAGYEPIGMLDFFKRLSDRQIQAGLGDIPPYLLTHPLSANRLTNLEAVLRERQWDRRERRPASLELQRVQLLTAIGSEQREQVLQLYADQVDKRPGDGRAHYLHGLALLEVGRLNAAAAALEAAAAHGFDDVQRELGRVRFRQRRHTEARDLLVSAAAAASRDALAHHALGSVYEALGDSTAALAAYREAVDIAPTMESAHYDLGMLAGRSGEVGAGYFHLGEAFRLRGEYERALGHFAKARAELAAESALAARLQQVLKEMGVDPEDLEDLAS